jgi:hypothetical protein
MLIRRLLASAAMLLITSSALPAEQAERRPQEKAKLSKAEVTQYQALNALVDAVMAAKEPAPADIKLRLQNHFVKSATGVFIPYVLEITAGKPTSFPLALYVRGVRRPDAAAAATTAGTTAAASYAFTDMYFVDQKHLVSTGPDSAELSRALELPPGEFDLYFAISEPPARNNNAPAAKKAVLKQPLSVPDFSKGFTTSTIVLGKTMDEAPQLLTAEQQMEQPFTLGGYKMAPAFTATFPQSGELLFVFFIYNEGAAASGKPDMDVEYYFYRAAETKPFSKAATSAFNATTLPDEFNLAAGHQVLVGQGIPLTSFAPGDYRLELKITDKTNSQTITRMVPFTVTP